MKKILIVLLLMISLLSFNIYADEPISVESFYNIQDYKMFDLNTSTFKIAHMRGDYYGIAYLNGSNFNLRIFEVQEGYIINDNVDFYSASARSTGYNIDFVVWNITTGLSGIIYPIESSTYPGFAMSTFLLSSTGEIINGVGSITYHGWSLGRMNRADMVGGDNNDYYITGFEDYYGGWYRWAGTINPDGGINAVQTQANTCLRYGGTQDFY